MTVPKTCGDSACVSVVIPAHNALNTLERALNSVAAQTIRPLEVIVIDDASVDGTSDIARNFPGLPMRVLRLDRQSGVSAARNRGIEASMGEFIAFLDADDEWLPDKTEIQLALLRNEPGLSFVTCEADLIAPGGTFMYVINPNRPRPHGQDAWKTLLRYPCVGTPCVMVRRDLVKEVGGFDPRLNIAEDQDLWIRLALRGPVYHIDRALVRVHDQPNSLSKAYRGQAKTATLPMVLGHVNAQRHRLSKAEIKAILGTRYRTIGRTSYETGSIKVGASLLAKAIFHGDRPMENLSYLALASPPMRLIKRVIGYEATLPNGITVAQIEPDTSPLLAVVVDTEEEFDWNQLFNGCHYDVAAVNQLPLAQQVCERHGVVPTYVVDYPIVNDANAVSIIKQWLQNDRAVIGAHLHPWVNPPFEDVNSQDSTYPGNLPFALEYRKLEVLTKLIADRFGVHPTIYKAGRCGLGPSTAKILKSLGYEIDASVLPFTNLSYRGGPDFSHFPSHPFWFGEDLDLFEVPLTRGILGALQHLGSSSFAYMDHPMAKRLGILGALARLGMLERVTLTPEGMSLDDHKRLTESLLKQGCKVFSYTFHSSSLLPGATQYVRTPTERDELLEKMDRYFDYFKREVGGRFATLTEIRDSHRRVTEPTVRQSEPLTAMTGKTIKASR